MGIITIKNNSERLYLNINIHTYTVIAPPSAPVIQSLLKGFAVGFCGWACSLARGWAWVLTSDCLSWSRKDLTSKKA